MMARPRSLSHLASGQVLVRFGARMIVLAVFAAFSSVGFTTSLITLMWMAIAFSAAVAIVRRERPFGPALSHWDETVAYAAVLSLVGIFAAPT